MSRSARTLLSDRLAAQPGQHFGSEQLDLLVPLVELEPEVEDQVLDAERLELPALRDGLLRRADDELALQVLDRLELARRRLHRELRLVGPREQAGNVH